MKAHVAKVSSACYYHPCWLRQVRHDVGAEVTTQLVLALVMSRLDYCNIVLAGVPQSTLVQLQCIQNAAARLVHQMDVRDHVTPSLTVLHWLPVHCHTDFKLCTIMYGIHTGRCPAYLKDIIRTSSSAATWLPAASTQHHGCEPSGRTRLLACRTSCVELTATRHSCCSQPCNVQETTQNALFNTAFSTC